MQIHDITLNNIPDMRLDQLNTYVLDKLYSMPKYNVSDIVHITNLDFMKHRGMYVWDGIRYLPISDEYVPIPVGETYGLDYYSSIGHELILLDIKDQKDGMLDNLTPFHTSYKGMKLYILTSDPYESYIEMENKIKNNNSMVVSYMNNQLIYWYVNGSPDYPKAFELLGCDVLYYNEPDMRVKWKDTEFSLKYGFVIGDSNISCH